MAPRSSSNRQHRVVSLLPRVNRDSRMISQGAPSVDCGLQEHGIFTGDSFRLITQILDRCFDNCQL